MAKVQVRVDVRALRALRRKAPEILKALDRPVSGTVKLAMLDARSGIPIASGELRSSEFIDGPLYNTGARLSTTWTGGYAHPQAGPIHEGFHWGAQTQTPRPHWLRAAFKGARKEARKGVAAELRNWLFRNFPQS